GTGKTRASAISWPASSSRDWADMRTSRSSQVECDDESNLRSRRDHPCLSLGEPAAGASALGGIARRHRDDDPLADADLAGAGPFPRVPDPPRRGTSGPGGGDVHGLQLALHGARLAR